MSISMPSHIHVPKTQPLMDRIMSFPQEALARPFMLFNSILCPASEHTLVAMANLVAFVQALARHLVSDALGVV